VSVTAERKVVADMPPHCDSKDGPVVLAAMTALETQDVDEALRFAPEEAEVEIRAAYLKALEARKEGPAAKEIADLYFAEMVVRHHRAGERAPYTGLKPAGMDVGPVIPVAERAISTGSVDELASLLSDTVQHQVKSRLDRVLQLKAQATLGLPESRAYTSAMLGLQVWAHKLHLAMGASAHEGHSEHHS
jgi:hypothetical protein